MVCSLLCSVNLVPKYLILAVQLKKKPTVRSENAAVSGLIADRSNFMSDCKQMQVSLKNGKQINLKRKKYQANILQNRFELCGSKLQKIQCKTVSVKLDFM